MMIFRFGKRKLVPGSSQPSLLDLSGLFELLPKNKVSAFGNFGEL